MRPRYYDPRVGYFVNGVTDYTYDPIKSETLLMVSRWRVEPRPADMERHRRGELVEPAKPIVFYVDRNTPEYLRPYVIAGIEEWQTAFEKIGFKNAIIGRMAPTPEEDPDFSIEDARYSCVSYKASPIPNAYGPHIADPRTGEILCSHVGLFHNVLALAQTWYFTQCAPVDPAARKLPLDKELMGKLMQYITAHEIGHTLGLRHNFAGSWTFSVEEIRDRDFVKNNSHGATIMDYMRFNYVAQPEDRIAPGDLIPKQGDYDRFAIAWGYQYLPQFKSAKEERAYLSQWTTGQRKANHRVFFGTESDPEDPRFQSEDLGDNAMQADALGIKNLKVLTANLVAWTAGDDEDYSRLTAQFRDARTQYLKYISHVTRYIGGRYNDASIRSEQMQGYVPVPRALQQEAMDFLLEHFFAEPVWLVEGRHADLTRFDRENFARGVMRQVYPMLLARSMTLIKHEALAGDKAYTFRDMDNALYADAFASLEGRAAIPLFDRIKQSEYVRSAMDVLKAIPAEKRAPELGMQVVSRLEPLADLCRQRAEQTTDTLTKNHLMGLSDAIMVWLGQDKRELLSAK